LRVESQESRVETAELARVRLRRWLVGNLLMSQPVLSRYLDPDILSRVADRTFEPRGLVVGNLAGAHKSPLAGFAVEFAGHREYVPGDDPKHIDWRLFFNRDKYFVKQYELETNFVCHLLLDISASMRYGENRQQKLLYAAQLAAVLAYSVVRQNDKVSLGTFDSQLRGFLPPSNSLAQILRITEHLDDIESVEKTDVAESLSDFAGRFARREIVIILSDLFCDLQGLEAAIQRLRFSRHEVLLFQTLHHDELTFPFEGPIRFLGLEVPQEERVHADDLRATYLEGLARFRQEVELLAERNGCEYLLVDTSRNMADLLSDYLDRRGRSRRV